MASPGKHDSSAKACQCFVCVCMFRESERQREREIRERERERGTRERGRRKRGERARESDTLKIRYERETTRSHARMLRFSSYVTSALGNTYA